MIAIRGKDAEITDAGARSGLPSMAFTRKWLVHREVGDESYGHRFALREFNLEPGVFASMHKHHYVEAVYVVSGKLFFENFEERLEVGPGDVLYTYEWEPHALGVIGDTPAKIVCCIDCVNGGDNCSPTSGKGGAQTVETKPKA